MVPLSRKALYVVVAILAIVVAFVAFARDANGQQNPRDSVLIVVESWQSWVVDITDSIFEGEAGDTVTFAATVTDSAGVPQSATLLWSTNDPTGVSIDSETGFTTLLRDGAYHGFVEVIGPGGTDPPDPPIPPVGTCEDVLFFDGFESGDLDNPLGGRWNTFTNPWGQMGPSTEFAAVGSHSWRMTYLATPAGRDSDVTLWGSFTDTRDEVWLQWLYRVPDNYVIRPVQPANTKFVIIGYAVNKLHGGWQGEGWATRMEVDPKWDQPEGPILATSQPYIANSTGGSARQPFGQPWAFPVINAADRGTWVKMAAHVKLASSLAAKDAEVNFYRNDSLIVGSDTLALGVAPGIPLPPIAAFELMGWSNAGFTEQTDSYIDEVLVCGHSIILPT